MCNTICFCSNPKMSIFCYFLRCSGCVDSAHAERLHGKRATVQKGSHSVPETVQRIKHQHRRPLEQPHTGVPLFWPTASSQACLTFPHNNNNNNLAGRQVELSTHYQNVSEMMSSWTSQKGFPLITVTRKGDEVTLTQEHFRLTTDNVTRSSR